MKNSRNTLAILFFLFSLAGMAQVGIGTVAPAATLDITATNLAGTTVDGLLVPRVSRLRAQTMTGTPTSTVLYVNDITVGTLTGTTINVNAVGFYYFDGTVWQKFGSAVSNDWAILGNSGLSGTTNFLGTTDGVDVAFRRNNAAAGKLGATSTSFGVGALTAGVATNNAAFGTNALTASTGADNVAVGNGALTTVSTGIQNTAVGNGALNLGNGSANTAVGFQALNKNTASNNTAIGFQTLMNSTAAVQNTAIGFWALNVATGSRSTAVGFQALALNVNGNENTAVGNYALGRNTGSGNTAMGHEAMFGSGTAFTNSTAIGWHALFNNSGNGNTALGYNALQGNGSTIGNSAVGAYSLNNNTGANNTALGYNAGYEHSTGDGNVYVGFEAGRYSSGTTATSNNAFLGYQAGHFSQGSFNTAIGSSTLKANAATANNVAIGFNALATTTGSGNVAIGYNAASLETGSNKLYIENSNGDQSNALIYGDFNTNIARVNGTFQINNPANANGYAMPNVRGTNGQVLTTDGAGATSWTTSPSTTLSMVRATLTQAPPTNQVLTTLGWQKVNFNTEVFDTGNEFLPATGTFTATKAGFYRINASIHTNPQSNTQYYSIAIYVNGALYQQVSANHFGNGPADRAVTCLVQLAVNGTVEVYVENWQTGAEIDYFSGKTVFEVQQIR